MSFHAELVGDRAELATLRAGTVLKEEREEGREEGGVEKSARFRGLLRAAVCTKWWHVAYSSLKWDASFCEQL